MPQIENRIQKIAETHARSPIPLTIIKNASANKMVQVLSYWVDLLHEPTETAGSLFVLFCRNEIPTGYLDVWVDETTSYAGRQGIDEPVVLPRSSAIMLSRMVNSPDGIVRHADLEEVGMSRDSRYDAKRHLSAALVVLRLDVVNEHGRGYRLSEIA